MPWGNTQFNVLDKKIDKDTLKAYITRNGNEIINE